MSRFGMIYEDPSYDEDGVLIDEIDPAEWDEAFPQEILDSIEDVEIE